MSENLLEDSIDELAVRNNLNINQPVVKQKRIIADEPQKVLQTETAVAQDRTSKSL